MALRFVKLWPGATFPPLRAAGTRGPVVVSPEAWARQQLGAYVSTSVESLIASARRLVSRGQAVPYEKLGYRLAVQSGYADASFASMGAWLLLVSGGPALFYGNPTRDLKLTQTWFSALAHLAVVGKLGPRPEPAGADPSLAREWQDLITQWHVPAVALSGNASPFA